MQTLRDICGAGAHVYLIDKMGEEHMHDSTVSKHLGELAEQRLRRMAKERVQLRAQQGVALSEPAALMQVLEENPELYARVDRALRERFR